MTVEPPTKDGSPKVTPKLLVVILGAAVISAFVIPAIMSKLNNAMGVGVSCSAASGVVTCTVEPDDGTTKYCWQMVLSCEGRQVQTGDACRIVAAGQRVELTFPADDLALLGCKAPTDVKVTNLRREHLSL